MKNQKLVSRAIMYATIIHEDQFDRGGNPYILHPLKLMHWARAAGYSEETQIVAILHDTAEDGVDGSEKILNTIEVVFGKRIRDLVDNVTKRDGEAYDDYMARVKSDVVSATVKCLDLRHNSDLRRLKGVSKKDEERTIKYLKAYAELADYVEMMTSKV